MNANNGQMIDLKVKTSVLLFSFSMLASLTCTIVISYKADGPVGMNIITHYDIVSAPGNSPEYPLFAMP